MCSLTKAGATILSLMLLASCQHEGRTTTHTYYAVDSLLSAQENQLARLKPTLVKLERVDERQDSTQVIVPDSIGWSRELALFKQLDLNKPSYANQYTTDWETEGSQQVIVYQRKDLEPVVSLRVYLGEDNTPLRLVGKYQERNALFFNQRIMDMRFEKQTDATGAMLVSFSLMGMQKMLFADTVHYGLDAVVRY